MRRRQKVFIEEYLRCWNAKEAAIIAGYSEKTARSIGCENLTKPDIQAEITKRLKEKQMGADEVLTLLSEQARADISDFVLPGGVIDWEIVRTKGRLVKKIKHTFGHASEIELHDPQHALELVGKAHRLFVERYEVDNTLTVVGLKALLDLAYGRNDTGS